MAASGTGASTTPIATPLVKYILLLTAFVGSIFGAYVLNVIPDVVGFAGAGTSIAALFAFAVADLESMPDSPVPTGVTFVVITVGAAVYGAVGAYTNQTFAVWTAFLAWVLLVLEYIFTTFQAQLSTYVPSAYDSMAVSGVGLVVALVQYLAANPGASVAALVVTGVVYFASHLNNNGAATAAPPSAPASTPTGGPAG